MTELWYYNQYNKLIDKCLKLEKEGFGKDVITETHHILPKCMGGTNDKSNLVKMSIRHHIFAHLFLMKAYPNNYKLSFAARGMLCSNKSQQRKDGLGEIPIRLIVLIREESTKNLKEHNPFKGKKHSEESKHKMSLKHKNVYPSEETRIKQSISKMGRKNSFFGQHHSIETKELISKKLSGENNPNFGKTFSKEVRDRVSKSKIGVKRKPFSDSWRMNMSLSKIGGRNSKARRIIDNTGRIFDTVKEAAAFHKICTDTLRDWCKNKPEKGFKYLS